MLCADRILHSPAPASHTLHNSMQHTLGPCPSAHHLGSGPAGGCQCIHGDLHLRRTGGHGRLHGVEGRRVGGGQGGGSIEGPRRADLSGQQRLAAVPGAVLLARVLHTARHSWAPPRPTPLLLSPPNIPGEQVVPCGRDTPADPGTHSLHCDPPQRGRPVPQLADQLVEHCTEPGAPLCGDSGERPLPAGQEGLPDRAVGLQAWVVSVTSLCSIAWSRSPPPRAVASDLR